MCPSSWKLYVYDFPFFSSSLACLEPKLELFEVWEINVRQIIANYWGCLSHRIVGSVGSGRCWFVYDWEVIGFCPLGTRDTSLLARVSNIPPSHWYSITGMPWFTFHQLKKNNPQVLVPRSLGSSPNLSAGHRTPTCRLSLATIFYVNISN